jgi:hypothetical protein
MEGLEGCRPDAASPQELVGNVGGRGSKVTGYLGHQVGVVGIIH